MAYETLLWSWSYIILFFILSAGPASWSRFATQNCGGFGERA